MAIRGLSNFNDLRNSRRVYCFDNFMLLLGSVT